MNFHRKTIFFFLALPEILSLSACAPQKKNLETPPSPLQLNETVQSPDFASIKNISKKKQKFIDFLLPVVTQENQHIKSIRQGLFKMQKTLLQGKSLTGFDFDYVKALAEQYKVNLDHSVNGVIQRLLIKIDILPSNLVLAQAANESAWGTSRFATDGHNYFGQWCFSKGCGLVPRQRSKGSKHEVAKFESVDQSVHAYMVNLNSNRAYKKLRKIRQEISLNNPSVLSGHQAGIKLAFGLKSYSARGDQYISSIQTIMKRNQPYLRRSNL
jgi:Bax protein